MASSESFQGSKHQSPPTDAPPPQIQNRWALHGRDMLGFHPNVAPSEPAVPDVCWHVNCGFNPRAGKYLLLYADAAMAIVTAADIPSTSVKKTTKKNLPTTASAFANTTQVQDNPELEEGLSFFFFYFLRRHKDFSAQTADVRRRLNLPVHVVNLREFNNL